MAGNNGLGIEVRAIGQDVRWWTGFAQEVKAVEEEIKALVAASRQRLFRAVDEEMRGMLRESLARLSETTDPELLPQAREAREAPILAPEVHSNGHEKWEAAAPLNGHKSSPTSQTRESLAELVTPLELTRSHAGTRNGVEDHEATLLEVASNGSTPGSGEAYSGTVQLVVPVEEAAIQALQFVDELCRHPSMRLQRLLGTAKGRLDIWVLLREPIHLKEALLGMEVVSQVNTIPAEGPQDTGVYLEVRLKEPGAVYAS
ncbi:MAG: hypothetical protein Q7K03_05160 [Dehalococcoidia bacterium]|nr:hypothetical protein [Dehalococcoidia bacterium]